MTGEPAPPAPPSRARRQRLIADLIRASAVVSQEEIVERLAASGLAVTQATVSRDLAAMGAIKARRRDQVSYALAADVDPPELRASRLRRLLAEWVESVETAGGLVVIRTPPACAHIIASALDHAGWPEIAGTIAGDDTLLAVVRDGYAGADLAARVTRAAGPSPQRGG